MALWFSAHPGWYWVIAWISFAGVLAGALSPAVAAIVSPEAEARTLRRFPRWLFVLLAIVCFVAFRWPVWCVPEELNPDESQMLAEAITLQHRPLYWGAADGATHGPLDVFPLIPLRWVGLRLDYFGARVLGSALMLLAIGGCYRAFAARTRESLARVAVLPIFCVLAFSDFWDWVHYSSEQMPVALLALGFWLLVADLERTNARLVRSPRWFIAGLLLGAVPMAKLQGAPVAAALIASGVAFDLWDGSIARRQRWQRTLVLLAASLIPTLFFAVVTFVFGAWGHAWISYVQQNLQYAGAGSQTLLQMLQHLWNFIGQTHGTGPYFAGAAVLFCLIATMLITASARSLRFVVLGFVFLLASLVSTLAPGRQFPHYLLFMAAPTGVFLGTIWLAAWEGGSRIATWYRGNETIARHRGLQITLLILVLGTLVIPQVVERVNQEHYTLGRIAHYQADGTSPVVRKILEYARPGESLGMWGWMCRYYVYTQMWQATRDAHSYLEIVPSAFRDYFRWRYLHDLRRNRPPVFVDAAGPGSLIFGNRDFGHESFPELRDFIAKEYRQVADLDGCRIYVRLDRLR